MQSSTSFFVRQLPQIAALGLSQMPSVFEGSVANSAKFFCFLIGCRTVKEEWGITNILPKAFYQMWCTCVQKRDLLWTSDTESTEFLDTQLWNNYSEDKGSAIGISFSYLWQSNWGAQANRSR